jgi:uracil-DNA glycosylase
MSAIKEELVLNIGRKRLQDRLPDPSYSCFQDYHGGAYDGPWPTPWTKSAHNVMTKVMVVGLDWDSRDNLSLPLNPVWAELGQNPELWTNRNIKSLLRTHFGLEWEETYATDLFVFVKPGGMSSNIRGDFLAYSRNSYNVPEIKAVEASLILCLGRRVYNLLRNHPEAKGKKLPSRYVSVREAIAHDEEVFIGGSLLIPLTHTGAMGINMAGGLAGVAHEWERARGKLDTPAKLIPDSTQEFPAQTLTNRNRALDFYANREPREGTIEWEVRQVLRNHRDHRSRDEIYARIIEARPHLGNPESIYRLPKYYDRWYEIEGINRKGYLPGSEYPNLVNRRS